MKLNFRAFLFWFSIYQLLNRMKFFPLLLIDLWHYYSLSFKFILFDTMKILYAWKTNKLKFRKYPTHLNSPVFISFHSRQLIRKNNLHFTIYLYMVGHNAVLFNVKHSVSVNEMWHFNKFFGNVLKSFLSKSILKINFIYYLL